MSSLELEPQGDDFVLKRVDQNGAETSITLSPDDVLKLAQSAQRMKDRIHASRSPKGSIDVTVGTVTPVAQCRLNTDIHQTEILLGMIDGQGATMEFALPLAVAQSVAQSLPRWVARLEAVAAKKVQ